MATKPTDSTKEMSRRLIRLSKDEGIGILVATNELGEPTLDEKLSPSYWGYVHRRARDYSQR